MKNLLYYIPPPEIDVNDKDYFKKRREYKKQQLERIRKIREETIEEHQEELRAHIQYKMNFGKLRSSQKAFLALFVLAWGMSIVLYIATLIPQYKGVVFDSLNRII